MVDYVQMDTSGMHFALVRGELTVNASVLVARAGWLCARHVTVQRIHAVALACSFGLFSYAQLT